MTDDGLPIHRALHWRQTLLPGISSPFYAMPTICTMPRVSSRWAFRDVRFASQL